jgi:hypothetical protein
MKPEIIEYAIQEFGRQLQTALSGLSDELSRMRERKEQLEAEVRRLVAAVAEQGHSQFLREAIADREQQLRDIADRLMAKGPKSVDIELAEIRQFVTERLSDLQSLVYADVALARVELGKHINEIRMEPNLNERHYTATGQWDLLGGYPKTGRARHLPGVRARMVAGACNVPNALVVPFRFDLVHASAQPGFNPLASGVRDPLWYREESN